MPSEIITTDDLKELNKQGMVNPIKRIKKIAIKFKFYTEAI